MVVLLMLPLLVMAAAGWLHRVRRRTPGDVVFNEHGSYLLGTDLPVAKADPDGGGWSIDDHLPGGGVDVAAHVDRSGSVRMTGYWWGCVVVAGTVAVLAVGGGVAMAVVTPPDGDRLPVIVMAVLFEAVGVFLGWSLWWRWDRIHRLAARLVDPDGDREDDR